MDDSDCWTVHTVIEPYLVSTANGVARSRQAALENQFSSRFGSLDFRSNRPTPGAHYFIFQRRILWSDLDNLSSVKNKIHCCIDRDKSLRKLCDKFQRHLRTRRKFAKPFWTFPELLQIFPTGYGSDAPHNKLEPTCYYVLTGKNKIYYLIKLIRKLCGGAHHSYTILYALN